VCVCVWFFFWASFSVISSVLLYDFGLRILVCGRQSRRRGLEFNVKVALCFCLAPALHYMGEAFAPACCCTAALYVAFCVSLFL
jgi:hypothetical protein